VGGSSSSGGGGSSLGPKLTADTLITKIGGPVTLSWDTNNGDEGLCTLTGGDIAARYTPIPRIGTTADERETGSVQSLVQGKTTYVLRCGAVTDSVTVGIIPDTKES
jgi:hypothetical protein